MSEDSFPQPPDPLAGRSDLGIDLGVDPQPLEADDLPPVEPPSAGFIVQLFVVPAIIVAVIVGVYLLFGQLASGEQDWRRQLTDIRSDNPHVRWRGALGMAQMLQADARTDGQRLAENGDVARELTNLFAESLRKASSSEDDLKQQEFLARTLGLIDVDEFTLPVLKAALQPDEDVSVRKNALASLATISNRRAEAGGTFDDKVVIDDVIAMTEERNEMLRHFATYTLGLFDSLAATERLESLLAHPDSKTQFNAAVGLARRGSIAGVDVFDQVLTNSQSGPSAPLEAPSADQSAESAAALEQTLMLSNSLRALTDLHEHLTPDQKQQLVHRLVPIAESYPVPLIRVDARQLMDLLES